MSRSEENERSERERVTEIGDRTFLDTKEGTEKESEKGGDAGGESEVGAIAVE